MNKRKKIDYNRIIKQLLKFNLPDDYSDELIDAHIIAIKHKLNVNKQKIKSILKINKLKK